jgi:hypothetical protein
MNPFSDNALSYSNPSGSPAREADLPKTRVPTIAIPLPLHSTGPESRPNQTLKLESYSANIFRFPVILKSGCRSAEHARQVFIFAAFFVFMALLTKRNLSAVQPLDVF